MGFCLGTWMGHIDGVLPGHLDENLDGCLPRHGEDAPGQNKTHRS